METVVLPEDILFVSGDKVRLAGRLIANNNLYLDNHGFQVALDNAFSSPISSEQGISPAGF